MELKTGYKQTEVGVIPVDWDVRRVIDIAENKKIALMMATGLSLNTSQTKASD
ncbi:hypothetical protein [Acidovorax temperans]|uniref:hypothetical protein n=1 Tax=Acidovorax temperans TaxID=80878 RepID=UPI000A54D710|nr:hypothetical protein [Acidovorax temperans]